VGESYFNPERFAATLWSGIVWGTLERPLVQPHIASTTAASASTAAATTDVAGAALMLGTAVPAVVGDSVVFDTVVVAGAAVVPPLTATAVKLSTVMLSFDTDAYVLFTVVSHDVLFCAVASCCVSCAAVLPAPSRIA